MKFFVKFSLASFSFILFIIVIPSCSGGRKISYKGTTAVDYPVDTPFVFNNKIVLQGKLSKDEKNLFETNLPNYWDDSALARKQQKFGIKYVVKEPPVFDSVNVNRSVKFMDAFMKAQGYFYATIKDSFYTDTLKNQYTARVNGNKNIVNDTPRLVTIVMTVNPGKPTVIDSVSIGFTDPKMRRIAGNIKKTSLLVPGKTLFAKNIIAAELDRIINLFRNRGYFLLTRDNLVAEADTMNAALLQFNTDPFVQAQKIAKAIEQRKQHPTCSVIIRLKENKDSSLAFDSSKIKVFNTGNVYLYPETGYTQIPDSVIKYNYHLRATKLKDSLDFITVFDKRGLFVPQPLKDHMYMLHARPYSDFTFYKTVNNLSQIIAWRQVDSRSVIRGDTVDFHIFLVPAVKQNITPEFQVTRNTGDFLSSNNLFGVSLNGTYLNRNVWKRAISSSTVLNGGVELSFDKNLSLLQTVQTSLSHTYSFPRFIAPFRIDKTRRLDNVRTLFSLNASYTSRNNFFRIRSFVTNFGYQWKKKNKLWQFTPLNIELYSLDTLPELQTAFQTNPFLRTAFNTGSVISHQLSFTVSYVDKAHSNITNYFNIGLEEAGSALGLIKSLQDKIYQYAKVQGQYTRSINYRHTQLAFRAVAGIGYNYGNNSRFGNTLPFFKQFIEGGPNSMRAWGLRQIGLGSSLLSDTASTSFRDRYGDMELETNLEYRFPVTTIGSVNINSAFFTDIGNIWNVRKDPNNTSGTFAINRLGKDIAIGVGTGLRFDFSYFLIRLDFGIKLKDPTRFENNGWLNLNNFTWRNYDYIVKDANTKAVINRNNYALQLGIGLPF